MNYQREKQAALEAVTEAAELCRQVRATMVGAQALAKEDCSPVTVADFGAQAVVCRRLQAEFPGQAIVAEEDSAALRAHPALLAQTTAYVQHFWPAATAETVCGWIDAGRGPAAHRFWTLDPIDGTKGFLRHDQYAIALALIEAEQVQVAALACPALPLNPVDPHSPVGVLFVAARGQGAAVAALGAAEFTPVRVSASAACLTESIEAAHGDHARQKAAARAAGLSGPSLRMDSQAKYGAVARGQAALYLRLPSPKTPDYREKIWDHAAGALLVEEAGGRVTDMLGRPLNFGLGRTLAQNRGVVVSNGSVHNTVLAALGD